MTVTANDTTSGITQYCYSQNSSGEGTCQNNGSISLTKLQAGTEYTYYIYAKDKASNSGISSKYNYTFKTKLNNLIDYLRKYEKGANGVQTLQTDEVNGLYRYKGTYQEVDNNFICLGPEGNTCQTDDDKNKYMYRIIGIADGSESGTLGIDKGQIKVIKAISIGRYQWHNSSYIDTDWDAADLQKKLNNTLFYNNRSLLDIRIRNLIKSVKWYKGDVKFSCDISFECPPEQEVSPLTDNSYPIGLMYASDYYNSWTYVGNQPYSTNSWLHITHGATTSNSSYSEWTMSKYGDGLVWLVHYLGVLMADRDERANTSMEIRPIFYLVNTIKVTGQGTEEHPFIINS